MTDAARAVLARLEAQGIPYTLAEHPAVYTMEEMRRLGLPDQESVAKNLFVRDHRKRRYFLLSVAGERRVDLKVLGRRLAGAPFGMASEADLRDMLGLFPGAVTPFGALNDRAGRVSVRLDETFRGRRVGVHPNDNTATVWLLADDLLAALRAAGCDAAFFDPGAEAEP